MHALNCCAARRLPRLFAGGKISMPICCAFYQMTRAARACLAGRTSFSLLFRTLSRRDRGDYHACDYRRRVDLRCCHRPRQPLAFAARSAHIAFLISFSVGYDFRRFYRHTRALPARRSGDIPFHKAFSACRFYGR